MRILKRWRITGSERVRVIPAIPVNGRRLKERRQRQTAKVDNNGTGTAPVLGRGGRGLTPIGCWRPISDGVFSHSIEQIDDALIALLPRGFFPDSQRIPPGCFPDSFRILPGFSTSLESIPEHPGAFWRFSIASLEQRCGASLKNPGENLKKIGNAVQSSASKIDSSKHREK